MKNILKVLVLVIVFASFSSCNVPDEVKEKYGVENQNKTGHEEVGDNNGTDKPREDGDF